MNIPEPSGRNAAYDTPPPRTNRSRAKWVFIGFMALATALLIAEHRVHVLGALPSLILLAFPLMHLFMHQDHSHGAHDDHRETRK